MRSSCGESSSRKKTHTYLNAINFIELVFIDFNKNSVTNRSFWMNNFSMFNFFLMKRIFFLLNHIINSNIAISWSMIKYFFLDICSSAIQVFVVLFREKYTSLVFVWTVSAWRTILHLSPPVNYWFRICHWPYESKFIQCNAR